MAELGQRACHVRRFDPLILNDLIMKSYEEIIQRTADFDYMMRTRLPEKYMPEHSFSSSSFSRSENSGISG